MKNLVIIGGEGNGGVIASCVEDNRRRFSDDEWEIAGFVNDYEPSVAGYPVLGKIDDIPSLLKNTEYFFAWGIHMIGRNILTAKTFERANLPRERLATIISNRAFVACDATVEPGAFVMANCYLGARSVLGSCSLMMANSRVGHDTRIAPLCHLSMGSTTGSYVSVGYCADVAIGASVIEKRRIGNFAVAGGGCLVTRDIPDGEIHIGIPNRFFKKIRED